MNRSKVDTFKRISTLAIFLVHGVPLVAQNSLSVVRSSTNSVEVTLQNNEPVAGVQFSLRSSSDISFGEPDRGARVAGQQWIVASHRTDDSTVNVVIFSSRIESLEAGTGSIIQIPIAFVDDAGSPSRVTFLHAMLAGAQAESLGVGLNNAAWSNITILASAEDADFTLGQNFPNPFNPSTTIAYRLNNASHMRLSVFDIAGREVARLADGFQQAGEFQVTWNSSSADGGTVASGMYFARLQVGEKAVTKRMVLLK